MLKYINTKLTGVCLLYFEAYCAKLAGLYMFVWGWFISILNNNMQKKTPVCWYVDLIESVFDKADSRCYLQIISNIEQAIQPNANSLGKTILIIKFHMATHPNCNSFKVLIFSFQLKKEMLNCRARWEMDQVNDHIHLYAAWFWSDWCWMGCEGHTMYICEAGVACDDHTVHICGAGVGCESHSAYLWSQGGVWCDRHTMHICGAGVGVMVTQCISVEPRNVLTRLAIIIDQYTWW